ncbi:MAG: DNA-processing protein DprA [candidate division Zixibacteria bacterium]|nr:DNA-processing protein DprA [Candidatus Tariuqbacter arcticus]
MYKTDIMSDNLAYSWFRLFSIEGLGPAKIHRIRARARMNGLTITDIFQLAQTDFEKVFAPSGAEIYFALHNQCIESTDQQYNWLRENDAEVIHLDHTLYPERLLTMFLDSAPVLLFALGKLELLECDGVAIVGSREAEPAALDMSREIAAISAESGWNVVSGYARGIDTAAHIGALKAGGDTTMILSTGLHNFYLRSALKELSNRDNSLILSQFHPLAQWEKHHAILRNQLTVGLSKAVVVVQAAEKSGTLNTANIALKAEVPLLVVSPDLFQTPPAGNIEIIERGAIEMKSISEIEKHLKRIQEETVSLRRRESDNTRTLPLF